MRNIILGGLILLSSAGVLADDQKFVTADGSELSQLCLAALEAPELFEEVAQEMGLEERIEETLACNGLPWKSFVRKYQGREDPPEPGVAFKGGDGSEETALCLAAVTSNDYFYQLKKRYSGEDVESEVLCNDQPLGKFARKYKGAEFSAAL